MCIFHDINPWYKIHLPKKSGMLQVVEHSAEGTEGRQSWTGRLNLVDLAGSERPRLTGAWEIWVGK